MAPANAVTAAENCVVAAASLEYFETADLGLQRQERFADEITSDSQRLLLVWQAPQALIVGVNDTRVPNFLVAANRLCEAGWPVIVRRSGGSACPVSRGTLQVALARSAGPGFTIDTAYIELADLIQTVFKLYGLRIETGAVPNAFCPGRYDLSIAGRKIAGLSQRWRQHRERTVVTTAATLILDEDVRELVRVVNLFYQLGGAEKRCSELAVGNMRQFLTADTSTANEFRNQLCRRIVHEAQKTGLIAA